MKLEDKETPQTKTNQKGERKMKLVYNANGEMITMGTITTNRNMTVEEAIELLNIDLDQWASDQGFDGYDFNDIEMNYEEDDMKKELTLENLTATHLNEDGTNTLEFTTDAGTVFLNGAKVCSDAPTDSEEYEFYWDDAENVAGAVEEAADDDIEIA